jgi:hypothetical protein
MYVNSYIVPAIISCIINVYIGIYIFYKNPKNIQNKVFIFFILFVIAFSVGEVMLRLSTTSEEGLLWGRIGYAGIIFMPPTALYLSFVLPRERYYKSQRTQYLMFGIYFIGILLFSFFNLFFTTQDVQLSEWGYRVALYAKFLFIGIWVFILGCFTVFNFFSSYKQSKSTMEKKQIKHIFYGGFIALILTVMTNVIPSLLGIIVFPMGTVALTIFSLFIAAAVLKYNLFTFKPMIEPVSEKKKTSSKRYKLKPGRSYIVREEERTIGYKIFTDQITHGIHGLCITKYSPQKIREKYNFKKTPFLWFTFQQSDTEMIVNPKKVDMELILHIEDFVKKEKQTIVYIDCFDQIMLVKGFDISFKLMNDVITICKENQSILLLSIELSLFDEKQRSILEKEFLEVK